jgi:hypothetical protein
MWTVSSEQAHGGFGLWFAFQSGGAAVSYAEVLRLWQSNDEFRSLFLNVLADAPYPEFRWETPPITIKTSQRPFEFVLLDSVSSFIRDPDPDSFADQFASAAPGEMAVEFPNLGNDGILIAPCPLGPHPAYVHLAVFVRQAPRSNSTRSGRLSVRQWSGDSRTSRFGSARPAARSRGCTCGSTTGRSTIATSRIGS